MTSLHFFARLPVEVQMKMKIKLNTKLWWKLYNPFVLKLSQATSIVVKAGFTDFFISFTISQKLLKRFRIPPENITKPNVFTVWNVAKCVVFSGPYFPTFGLNRERYFVSPYSVRIQENTDQKKLRIWTLFTQWFWYFQREYETFIILFVAL